MPLTDQYPYEEGDTTVLGPEIFASRDEAVISWKGRNYVPQMEPVVVPTLDQAAELLTVVDGEAAHGIHERGGIAIGYDENGYRIDPAEHAMQLGPQLAAAGLLVKRARSGSPSDIPEMARRILAGREAGWATVRLFAALPDGDLSRTPSDALPLDGDMTGILRDFARALQDLRAR